MIYDYITTKPPLDENTMSEYGLTYLEHGRMKGWVAATHKYLDRVWKNGKWVYSYAKKAGSGALRTARSKASSFSKSLSKSTNSGLNRLGSMMDRIRKKYGNGQAKAAAKKAYNTAKDVAQSIGEDVKMKTKNKAKRIARSTRTGVYFETKKIKDAAKKAYSEAKNTAKQAKVSAQNAVNTAKKEGKYLATKTKNTAKKTVDNVKKKNYVERAKGKIRNKVGKTDHAMVYKIDGGGGRETDDNSAYVKKNTNPLTNARKKKKYAETYKKNKYQIERGN